jgi:hypothetical protein
MGTIVTAQLYLHLRDQQFHKKIIIFDPLSSFLNVHFPMSGSCFSQRACILIWHPKLGFKDVFLGNSIFHFKRGWEAACLTRVLRVVHTSIFLNVPATC